MMLLASIALMLSSLSYAGDLINVDELGIQYKRYGRWSRDPIFYKSHPKESLDLTLNTDVLTYFGLDNTIHSMTNESQFYLVGLNTRFYLRLSSMLEVGVWHYSKHVLDDK